MNDEQLDSALADLAREDAEAGPSARAEARMLAAWDEWTQARNSRSVFTVRGRRWVLPAVAALAASGILALALPRPLVPPPSPGSPHPFALVSVPEVSDVRAALGAATFVRPDEERPQARQASVAQHEPEIESAQFIPLGPDIERSLGGSFQLARVRVPRDVLVNLGVLVEAHRAGEPIQADVVFGEDGLARAIRLAPASRRVP